MGRAGPGRSCGPGLTGPGRAAATATATVCARAARRSSGRLLFRSASVRLPVPVRAVGPVRPGLSESGCKGLLI